MTSETYPKLRWNLQITANDDKGIVTSCMNCINFVEQTELCRLFAARPPAKVIAFGCKDHVDIEEVPF